MPIKVSDVRANLNENILHAVKVIGKSKARRQVFEAIYRGKKGTKTVAEIAEATGLSRMRVLQEAGNLHANHIVEKVKVAKQTAYKKDEIYTHYKKKVLSILDNPSAAEKIPTKQRPKTASSVVRVVVRGKSPSATAITVDDIDSFREVRTVGEVDSSLSLDTVSESAVKNGLQRIIGETHEFKDWGGEKNDLYTNKLTYKGKRRIAAFALKGKATRGVLTPKKMGKNGDQIARLVGSAASVFMVVYHSKIDESVVAQLETFALGKALGGKPVYFGVIDGDDLNRLYQAYPGCFQDS